MYSHGIVIDKMTTRAKHIVHQFSANLTQFSIRKVGNDYLREMKKVFAARTDDLIEYRYNRNQLEQLLSFLHSRGIGTGHYTIDYVGDYIAAPMTLKMPDKFVPREAQVPLIEYILAPGHIKAITLQTGQGKAAADDTLIKIPNGWRPIGEIKVGQHVITQDGTSTLVTGVYPQGKVPLLRVEFADGRTIDCCKEHLWSVEINHEQYVLDTQQIKFLYVSQDCYIPLVESERNVDIDSLLPVASVAKYVLGREVDSWDLVRLHTRKHHDLMDPDLVLGRYLFGSTKQRRELLSYFITDGVQNDLGDVIYIGTAPSVAIGLQLQYLARSLGYLCAVDDSGLELTIIDPKERKLKIVSITEIEPANATCISVDHPSELYVAKDFIVTHNTKTALAAGALLAKRTAIVVLARFVNKWIDDVNENYSPKPGQLIICKGFTQIKHLLQAWSLGTIKEFDVIIFSSSGIQDYIRHYEATRGVGDPEWLIPPQQLFPHLGIGYRIIDEVHMFFHLNFKMDLYSHLQKGVYLSATLESADPFTTRMYNLAYPMSTRMNGGAYIKYAKVSNIEYRLVHWDRVKCKRNGNYNHIVYEEWIMKKDKVLQNYLDMIYNIVKQEYLDKKVDKQKCLIFAASIEMCIKIRDYLKARIKDLVIGKYTAEDPYTDLINNDITVSTLGSSGTAVDIPDLAMCLMTTAVSEVKANLQALGRLRMLAKYPDLNPHFIYLTCLDITKHKDYDKAKRDLFLPRVVSLKSYPYGKSI